MKRLRPILVPVASFALAWTAAFLVSRRADPPPPDEAPAPRLAAPRPRANQERPRHREVAELVESFRQQATAEWPGLWDRFAAAATVADLEAIAATTQVPRYLTGRRNAGNVPRMLALEELAARSELPPADVPGAYATLAERDPEAAWQRLGHHPRSDFAIAVARTLARHDPADTLRRIQSMPEPLVHGRNYESDAGEGGMSARSPLGAVFAAWARHDPAAAAAAVRQLPPADRTHAAGQVALTWSFHDGPAAIRFLLDSGVLDESSDPYITRLDAILRASLRNHGAETARLIVSEPPLRLGSSMRCIYKPWFDADPDGLMAWVLEEKTTLRDYEELNSTERWNRRGREVLDILACDPHAAATMIRGLAAAGSNHGPAFIPRIRRHDPAVAAELAREFDITLPDVPTRTSRLIDEDPAQACDLWLAALREHQDPEQALAALAWSKSDASTLAHRAAMLFPEKAAELARLVPADALERSRLGRARSSPQIGRFWPDLAQAERDPSPPQFPISLFLLDPATAADSPLAGTPNQWQVKEVIKGWALYDTDAAMAWLARVPDAAVRQAGEATLFRALAAHDPAAALRIFVENPTSDRTLGHAARSCLRRIMAGGGDWRAWHERIPPAQRPSDRLSDFEAEARLLEKLRQF